MQVKLIYIVLGWDQGIVGLCKGAKATIIVPPDMGYGAGGAGPDIPGGATVSPLELVTSTCI